MPAPTVDYKVLSHGYKISGDVRSGYKATVPYLVAWKDYVQFVDDIFGGATASSVGPITWHLPYRLPASNWNLYAQAFTVEPVGANGAPITSIGRGLAPGEFFSHALVTVEFTTPNEIQSSSQDPGNRNQLDPNNPITMCEQSITVTSKMLSGIPGQFVFSTSSKPVNREFAINAPEVKLVLTFPRIPFLPWKLIKPYIGTVNQVEMLNCEKGTALLEGMDTRVTQQKGQLGQQLTLHYQYSTLGDWNTVPNPSTGTFDYVYRSGGPNDDTNRIYLYKDHTQIFTGGGFVYNEVGGDSPMLEF